MADKNNYFDPITLDEYFLYSLPDITSDNRLIIPELQLKTFNGLANQPQLQVSELTKMFQHYTLSYLPIFFGKTPADRSFTNKLAHTKMFSYKPGAYKLLNAVYLEIRSLTWHLDNAPDLIQYISKKDIVRIRYNLRVMADWCGDYTEYVDFIPKLRQLEIDLGFIENKLNYIVNHYGYTK